MEIRFFTPINVYVDIGEFGFMETYSKVSSCNNWIICWLLAKNSETLAFHDNAEASTDCVFKDYFKEPEEETDLYVLVRFPKWPKRSERLLAVSRLANAAARTQICVHMGC